MSDKRHVTWCSSVEELQQQSREPAELLKCLTWCLATNPTELRTYKINVKMVVAEFVMHLAELYEMDSDNILVLCIDEIPDLEDELDLYAGKHMFVYLMQHLRDPDIEPLWPIPYKPKAPKVELAYRRLVGVERSICSHS